MAGGQAGLVDLAPVMAIGLAYDLVASLYLFALFIVYLTVIPERLHASRAHRGLLAAMFALTVFGLIYLGAVEYFFFDEFNSRFNFVAVEYLIYPHEVFVNIWESYPVGRVLMAAVALTAAIVWLLRRSLLRPPLGSPPWRKRLWVPAVWSLPLVAATAGLTINSGRFSDNRVVNELAMNGVYAFFSAALNSELDYSAFYLALPGDEAATRVRKLVATPEASFFPGSGHIERRITASAAPKHLNVVVLLEESLGAEFVGSLGDKRGLTPNIDLLSERSLFFTRTYATGTRTVRGMEGVSASFPPVPAESIVKRPHNDGMFNWSGAMKANGYSPTFIYGGFGTFDNMNRFFGSNGYRVIDRTDLDPPKFANIWGVSDEDLLRNAVRIYDEQHAKGERIFSIVMTTSNHKPFTFPPGVPGVAEKGGGRDAGVRYADYAIGRFIELARTRSWFDDTLFVIVADHGARVYGREDIPVSTYAIPLLIYSPKHVAARRIDALTSQIDVAPTVMALLGLSYDSTFFGIDVLHHERPDRLIPLNHNRDIALFDGRHLYAIGFRKTSSAHAYDPQTHQQTAMSIDAERISDTVAFYQLGYQLYRDRRYCITAR
jgi:phosphoglycerol transferase MdoB-like AlkP superfamily enzyme